VRNDLHQIEIERHGHVSTLKCARNRAVYSLDLNYIIKVFFYFFSTCPTNGDIAIQNPNLEIYFLRNVVPENLVQFLTQECVSDQVLHSFVSRISQSQKKHTCVERVNEKENKRVRERERERERRESERIGKVRE